MIELFEIENWLNRDQIEMNQDIQYRIATFIIQLCRSQYAPKIIITHGARMFVMARA